MGSVLQFAAFLSICWLIRGAVTHGHPDEDKILNNKNSNRNGPGTEDFYFEEQKANDDNAKTGGAIPESKEDKKQTQTAENKTGAQFSDEFSFKNALSYFLNMLHELKEDILGLKEMASLKNTKDLTNSLDKYEDKVKQNEMGENNHTPKPDVLTKNTAFQKENQKHESNYIIDYYQNNDVKFVEDDLETSSDESDDSSHKSNEEATMHEVSENEDDACILECSKIKRKPNINSSEAEETTAIPTSQAKIPAESDKKFDDTKDKKDDSFKASTKKPSKMKQNNSKTSIEETENTPCSKTGSCKKNNYDNYNNLNEKNETNEKPLKSAKYVTRSPQNKTNNNLSKMIPPASDLRSSGKKSKNKDGSDFDSKSGILGRSTTLSFESSIKVIYPENIENEPYAPQMSSEKPIYKKQQEQTTSPKPEDQEKAQNNAKSLKNSDRANEYSIVSLQLHEAGSEIPNDEISTDIEKDRPKDSKGKRLNANSSHTTVPYSDKEPNSKIHGQQNSNSFDTGNTISPTTSGNIMNTDNLNKDPSDNLNGKKLTNENEISDVTQQGENDSETQRDSKTEQTKPRQLNNDFKPEKILKNNRLNYSNPENNYKEEDVNLDTMTTNDLPSPQDSNREIQNHYAEGYDKPQKNEELQNKWDGMSEISPDHEYEFEEVIEDFDISDELADIEEMDGDFNQNQKGEIITKDRNKENEDEINMFDTETVLSKQSQIYQHTENVMEEKPQEQYDTFLEYFYNHSNNPIFLSLRNQSNN